MVPLLWEGKARLLAETDCSVSGRRPPLKLARRSVKTWPLRSERPLLLAIDRQVSLPVFAGSRLDRRRSVSGLGMSAQVPLPVFPSPLGSPAKHGHSLGEAGADASASATENQILRQAHREAQVVVSGVRRTAGRAR